MRTDRHTHRLVPLFAASSVAALALAGCSSSKKDAAGTNATQVKIEMTSDGCVASPSSIPAGPAVFSVHNNGASAVSEAELMDGSKILGEKEGLTPGLTATFSLSVKAGAYQVYCPGAKTERSDFLVTAAVTSGSTSASSALLDTATTSYKQYVQTKADTLVTGTAAFVAAVKAGDVTQAKSLYATARSPYEAIEPVAESFGDLDPEIDAREGDVPDHQWGGFHRIEKQLWISGNTDGMSSVADKLLVDVKDLQSKIGSLTFQPAQLANGATDLLNEVSLSKLTGEEERYSHTDVDDIVANVDGAKTAFILLAPSLTAKNPDLVTTLTAKFADMDALLAKYKQPSRTYALYPTLTPAQIRELTIATDAVAEPMSKVGELVVTGN